MLACPHQSHSHSLLSTTLRSTTLFSRNTMIFASFALLSGMVLSASAAPWYSPPAPVTHWVDVSNDNAELFYNPPYIVSQQTGHLISTVVLTRLFQSANIGDKISFKFHPKNHTVTQSSFEYPCTPLYGGVDTGLCVSSISPCAFSDCLCTA